ncbi:MAG: PilZ domain-containing protein [Candidatus Omnitrophica bacterium]|nr:PilZ domain-containing protein [Candidatus Omnitrophota bacterium]
MESEAVAGVYSGPDRRKSKRIKAAFTVTYKLSKHIETEMWLEGREFSSIMIDLSADGMAILTEKNIPKGAVLSISFTLNNEFNNQSRTMQIEGEVRYNMPLRERSYRLGIVFTQVSDDDRFKIVEFVDMTMIWDPSYGLST